MSDEMQILSNSRQVPKSVNIVADKKYFDILYGYLQVVSNWSGNKDHNRYILKKDMVKTKIASATGTTRQTVAKKITNLIELGLLEEKEDRYELITINQDLAALIPFETLRKLTAALSENAISIYVYLLNRYYAVMNDVNNKEKRFIVTHDQLKKYIGISVNTRSNNYITQDILEVLEKLGLVEKELQSVQDKISGEYKDYICITKVNVTI